jgi:hypothetical protein
MVPAFDWSWCCLLLHDDKRLRNSALSVMRAGRGLVGLLVGESTFMLGSGLWEDHRYEGRGESERFKFKFEF